jgi:hypothetical protein
VGRFNRSEDYWRVVLEDGRDVYKLMETRGELQLSSKTSIPIVFAQPVSLVLERKKNLGKAVSWKVVKRAYLEGGEEVVLALGEEEGEREEEEEKEVAQRQKRAKHEASPEEEGEVSKEEEKKKPEELPKEKKPINLRQVQSPLTDSRRSCDSGSKKILPHVMNGRETKKEGGNRVIEVINVEVEDEDEEDEGKGQDRDPERDRDRERNKEPEACWNILGKIPAGPSELGPRSLSKSGSGSGSGSEISSPRAGRGIVGNTGEVTQYVSGIFFPYSFFLGAETNCGLQT